MVTHSTQLSHHQASHTQGDPRTPPGIFAPETGFKSLWLYSVFTLFLLQPKGGERGKEVRFFSKQFYLVTIHIP